MESFLTIMLSAYIIMLFAEFGDKTQLIALSLMTRSTRPFFVALMSTIGIALSTVISVLIGLFIGSVLPLNIIRIVSAVIFIILGVLILIGKEENEEEDIEENVVIHWYQPIYLVGLAEIGDKSQIFVITAAAATYPLAIFFGSTLGMATIMFATAIAGAFIVEKINEEYLEYIAGSLFIIAGLWIGITSIVS